MEIELVEFLRLIMCFFVYSFFGWILESSYKTIYEKKWVNSGFLHGPLCPIYGTGAIMMILFLSSFKNNIFLLFVVGFVILSIWEYFVGWLLETLFNTKYWDYTNNKFNLKGRVCLFNSTIWGLLGVIFTKLIHPLIGEKIIFLDNEILLCLDLIFIILIVIDTIISAVRVTNMNKALEKFKDIGDNLKEKLDELKELNSKRELNIERLKDIKESTLEKIGNVKDGIGEKIENVKDGFGEKIGDVKDGIGERIEDVRDGIEEKIRGIEKSIEDLKAKQNAINIAFYGKAKRMNKAFPTMKSEKMSLFFNQKIDEKKLAEEKKIKRKSNKSSKTNGKNKKK